MNKIKKQISDLRKTTPRHIQWLLMAAAFVVVIILLTMIIGGKKDANDDEIDAKNGEQLQLFIEPENLDWSETPVGTTEEKKIIITASAPVKVIKVRRTSDIQGLSIDENCSTSTVTLDKKQACAITVKYAPTAAMKPTGTAVYIDWHGARESANMKQDARITMVLGAVGDAQKSEQKPEQKSAPQPAPAPAPKPLPEPEPIVEPVAEPEPDPVPDEEPAPIIEEMRRDIELITPSDSSLFDAAPVKPARAANPVKNERTQVQTYHGDQVESCSDFAIPGYDTSGRQAGWIKPENGTYYFHPFADKNCDTPTGRYNPDNGIITDINNPGKKIGTDAEHIGYGAVSSGVLPQLNVAPRARQSSNDEARERTGSMKVNSKQINGFDFQKREERNIEYASTGDTVKSTKIYDRTFILRQYKPIPATIVSDVRADAILNSDNSSFVKFPVRATVDRNVYSDNGRTVIIPTGTLLLGYVTGDVPGPYKTIGRMNIRWYQFILPNGVEFNFGGNEDDPFSGDSQGRVGVPGRGSTDYLEQFVMPMLTAIVPAAVNMIAPIADRFVNQIDLDNNTVVQSGTVRSSELAKNEIITAWNQVAQKLMVDMMDNNVPPFTIPAGTRITVYSPVDLQVSCGEEGDEGVSQKCAVGYGPSSRAHWDHQVQAAQDDSWVGQVRSFNAEEFCEKDSKGNWTAKSSCAQGTCGGMDYKNLLFYCQTLNYEAKNNAKYEQVWQNQQDTSNKNSIASISAQGQKTYNEQVLGLKYDEDTNAIINPFQSLPKEEAPATITCLDGSAPDSDGCCAGETLTDMGDQGYNCCPDAGGDCFPPIE